MGKSMYDCILAYIRLLPWVKCCWCLPPKVNHDLLFALGIAECFLLPLTYFINAGSELWELSGRFSFACGGTESLVLTAVTGTEVQSPLVVSPELIFCRGENHSMLLASSSEITFVPIIWYTTGFRWHKMSSLAVGTTQLQCRLYSFFHSYLEAEWKERCALYWAYLRR